MTGKTIFPVFSITKGVTALAVHLQAERGLIDVTKPIASYRPEFKANGKEGITVEMELSHRSGIPQMPEGVMSERFADWEWMVKRVAQLKPTLAPGTANAYHVLLWAWILREVVRMTDPVHRPFDVFVYEEICKPLGIENFYLGVPDNELVRVAKLYGGNSFALIDEQGISPPSVFPGADVHNTKVIQQAVDLGAGAITDAGSVARIFALIANGGELDGVRLLLPERTSVAKCSTNNKRI